MLVEKNKLKRRTPPPSVVPLVPLLRGPNHSRTRLAIIDGTRRLFARGNSCSWRDVSSLSQLVFYQQAPGIQPGDENSRPFSTPGGNLVRVRLPNLTSGEQARIPVLQATIDSSHHIWSARTFSFRVHGTLLPRSIHGPTTPDARPPLSGRIWFFSVLENFLIRSMRPSMGRVGLAK